MANQALTEQQALFKRLKSPHLPVTILSPNTSSSCSNIPGPIILRTNFLSKTSAYYTPLLLCSLHIHIHIIYPVLLFPYLNHTELHQVNIKVQCLFTK